MLSRARRSQWDSRVWRSSAVSSKSASGTSTKTRAPGFAIKPDGNYLITGAFGGYGKVLGRWLVDCGARHLVLTSRSGASNPGAAEFVAELQDRGVKVGVVPADISV